jgi:hypothetical protein
MSISPESHVATGTEVPGEDRRIEIIARALAQHRLGRNELARELHSESAKQIVDSAVDRLWPLLKDEAWAVLAALDHSHE